MMKNIKYYIGVDLGGTTTKIGIFDEKANLIDFYAYDTDITEDYNEILVNVVKKIDSVLEKNLIQKFSIVGIGIGVPGPVDKNGNVKFAVNLGWNKEFNINEKLNKLTGLSVYSANDASLATLGETWHGVAKGFQDVAMFTLGTGVGGGLVINGKVVYGVNGESGEFGHLPVCGKIIKNKCKCGKKGCLEQYASAKGIVNLAKNLADNNLKQDGLLKCIFDNKNITAKDIWEFVLKDDSFAIYVVNIFANKMAKAIDMILKTNNPEIIILGGGMSCAGQIIIDYINKAFSQKYKSTFSNPNIVLAKLGNMAGTYGAAYLVMQNK